VSAKQESDQGVKGEKGTGFQRTQVKRRQGNGGERSGKGTQKKLGEILNRRNEKGQTRSYWGSIGGLICRGIEIRRTATRKDETGR